MRECVVYRPGRAEGFELCQPVDEDFYALHQLMDGSSRASSWHPIAMRVYADDEGRRLRRSDAPWCTRTALVFRENVIGLLGELLRRDGELLPVDSPEPLWLYNTNVVVDALDERASSIVRFDSGVIMDVETYVLRPEAIAGHVAFKLSALRASPTFLCSPFVELWKKHKLNGLTFKEIYRLTFQ